MRVELPCGKIAIIKLRRPRTRRYRNTIRVYCWWCPKHDRCPIVRLGGGKVKVRIYDLYRKGRVKFVPEKVEKRF